MNCKKSCEIGKEWLKKNMRPYRTFIAFLCLLSVVAVGASVGFAYFVKYLINFASGGNEKKLWTIAAVLFGLLLFKIVAQTTNGYFTEKLRAKIVKELRVKIFSKILSADYAKVQAYHSGELLSRLTSDVQEVATDTAGLLPTIFAMAVQCMGAIVALLTINPLFTAIYVVGAIALSVVVALFRKSVKKRQKEYLQADEQSRSYMQENIASLLTIKAYGAEKASAEKSETFSTKYYSARMRRNTLQTMMRGTFSLLGNFGLIFAVIWGGISVLKGSTDYGSILSVVLLLMQLQQPFTAVSSVLPVIYTRQASAERLNEIEEIAFAKKEEVCCDMNAYEKTTSFGLENVTFTYGRENVFSDVSMQIKKGEIVCITGESGVGKSTLFKLFLNVFVPSQGNVYLENEEGKTSVNSASRALFAYVPQGNFLFSGTILENLTRFCNTPNADDISEKIQNALTVACADFVHELPQGLRTVLAEKGEGLSEGQLQRLAIARALLSDRPILLLDEATSALDAATEKQLLENVKKMQDKTCVIITHRAAALSIADSVWNVEDGKINRI